MTASRTTTPARAPRGTTKTKRAATARPPTAVTRPATSAPPAATALLQLQDKALNASANAIVITNRDGRIQWANPAFTRLTGYDVAEVLGQNLRLLKSGQHDDLVYGQLWKTILAGDVWQGEVINRRKDGTLYTEEMTITPVRNGDGAIHHFIAVKQDITARKLSEAKLARVNRALSLLSACNEALVRAKNEPELIRCICQSAVESGGFRMAWVGFAEHDPARSIRPVAHAGVEEGYLGLMRLTWADTERGRGPAGIAVRTGEPCWLNDLAQAPSFKPWRAEALRRGYASVITLPLRHASQTLGVLSFFAAETGAFTDDVIALLRQLADDLAYGLDALRARTALCESERFVRATLDSLSAHVAILDRSGTILAVNQAWRCFAQANPPVRGLVFEGANYLAVCDAVRGEDRATALAFAAGVRAVLAGEQPEFSLEYACHSPEEQRWFVGRVTRFIGDGPVRVVVAHENITARKQAEVRLRASEESYRLLFKANPHPMWVYDLETLRFLAVNDAAVTHYGYTRDEFLAMSIQDIRPEAELPRLLERVAEVQDGGDSAAPADTGHWQHLRKDGSQITVEITAHSVTLGNRPARLVLAHDVTGRLRAERQAAVFARLAHELGVAATAEQAGQIIVTAAEELFGWDACLLHVYDAARDEVKRVIRMDTINGRKVHDVQPPAETKPSELFYRVLREGGQLILRDAATDQPESGLRFGDTSRRPESLMYVPIRHGQEAVGVFSIQSYMPRAYNAATLDTLQTLADHCAGTLARIRARESLETSEARYRLLVENQGEGLGVVDCDERFLLSNPAADKIFGVARGGLLGRSLMEFLSPEQREVVRQQSDHRARGKPGNYELTITRSDGRSRVLLVTVTPQADEHGKYTQAFEIFRDITQRKRAELMVARSELRLRLIWEHALTPMRLTDETGKIVMVNRAFCQFARKGREQLEGHPLWVAYDPANKDTVLRDYMERFQRGNDIQQRTVEVKFWDGRRASVEMAETLFNLPGQPPLLLSVAHDITERRELEAQIRQMQRLESVGQLAAGVAHDFNNMLAVIQGQAYILNMDLGPDCPAAESVRQIQQAAERAANLTRQLLLFSRKQTLQANVLNLGETVQNMAKMLRRLLGEHIEIEFVPPAESASVLADVGMMEQVLLNLCVNARDSMPHGGRLRVETRVVEVTADDARHMPEARAGRHVCLSVADTGSGIPPETLARIFEPFFTTKAVGKGTGLGLATVYGIVRQHQGWIAVDTELGQGTTFQVFLPFNDGQVLAAGPEATAPRLLAGSGKTLLVVEDEPGLRGVTCTILQRQGYRVLTAESGPQALELAKTAGPLDLMITDMVMPHMSGRELADALRQLQPNLRVLFTSGYSAEASDTTFLRRAGGRFLPKPYAAEVLCRTVAECLEEKPA